MTPFHLSQNQQSDGKETSKQTIATMWNTHSLMGGVSHRVLGDLIGEARLSFGNAEKEVEALRGWAFLLVHLRALLHLLNIHFWHEMGSCLGKQCLQRSEHSPLLSGSKTYKGLLQEVCMHSGMQNGVLTSIFVFSKNRRGLGFFTLNVDRQLGVHPVWASVTGQRRQSTSLQLVHFSLMWRGTANLVCLQCTDYII